MGLHCVFVGQHAVHQYEHIRLHNADAPLDAGGFRIHVFHVGDHDGRDDAAQCHAYDTAVCGHGA